MSSLKDLSTKPTLPALTEVTAGVDSYPLSRDFIDFNRLNLQHHLWKDIFGYTLHPGIPRDSEFLKVADIATGTGSWLLDLHTQLKPKTETELVGLDVDIEQAGPHEWFPPNFSLRKWSVFDEVPKDLLGAFDIVNVRLIVFVIEHDPTSVLRNLLKLLKPGGYLQWCEIDLESQHIETVTPDVSTECLEAVQELTVLKDTNLKPKWVRRLRQTFKTEGLEEVADDWQTGKRHTRLAMHWCNMHIPMMISDKIRETNPEKATLIDAAVQGAIVETRKGAMYAHTRTIVIGRKPSKITMR